MKKNKIIYILGITILAFNISCESYSEEVNVDPNNFSDAPASLIVGQAMLAVSMTAESQASRYSGIFTDQFGGCDRQFISYENYNVIAGDFDDVWTTIYNGAGQAKLVQQKATAEGNAVLAGVGQILEAQLIGEATALYGDVPFTEIAKPIEFPNPKYDKQADVLNGIQALLDKAIASVGTVKVSNAYGSKIYVNNDATWAKVAYSLKARYYLIAKKYPEALAAASKGISSSSEDLLNFHSSTDGQENLYWQFEVEQRGGYIGTCNHPYLEQLLDGTKTRKISTPGDSSRRAKYYANGTINTDTGGIFEVNASYPVISYVETKLIQAEAAARTVGDALTPFNDVRSYLETVYGGSFPASASTGDALIGEILEEKYISLFGSAQVFHDMRRTNNLLGITVKVNTTPIAPQRFLYPQIELNSNKNFPGVVSLFIKTPVNN